MKSHIQPIWKFLVLSTVLTLVFLFWFGSGHKLKIGRTKISGGFATNGEILNLMDIPQGFSFSSGVTVGSKVGFELESESASFRIWNTQFSNSLERWVEADNYFIPVTTISEQDYPESAQTRSEISASSNETDPFK